MKKILLVFGTRPEAIKMCPLANELKKRNGIRVSVCLTGQHREMLAPVLTAFGVRPDYDLSVGQDRQSLFDITGHILARLPDVLKKEVPDMVLLHGDTTTAFAAALTCFYLQIPVGHVEAGLRTYCTQSPYPEEFNRRAIAVTAQYHFAPTRSASDNLLREGIAADRVFITGNTVIDAMRHTVRKVYSHPELDWADGSRWILLTAHRRESIGEPMHRMFRAIRRVIEEHPDCKGIFPMHMNPSVRAIAKAELGTCPRIHLIEPVDVTDFHNLEARCYLCLTDSGGIQEECPSYGKPVLVMRDTTERPEGIAAGVLRLVGTDEASVYANFTELLDDADAYKNMARSGNPYGDGHASERIADILESGRYSPFAPTL